MRAADAAAEALRVCADPNNLPFSNSRGEGFENRIASVVSGTLHRKLVYTWWVERDKLVRNTLNAGRCDVLLGVPEGFEDVLTTAPYYRSTYVFVYRNNSGIHVHSLYDPALRHLRIGVHVLGSDLAPPASLLASEGIRSNVAGYNIRGSYGEPNPPARLIDAVASGKIDVAIVWGPLAGFFAQREPQRLVVAPVEPRRYGPVPFSYAIVMAVGKRDASLRNELDRALAANRERIRQILTAFGVPLASQ